jgi:hypothetical protein
MSKCSEMPSSGWMRSSSQLGRGPSPSVSLNAADGACLKRIAISL